MASDKWREAMATLQTDVEEQPFPTEEYKQRLDGVRANVREENLDALLVVNPENIYYLTGYDTTGYYSHQALVVPTEGEPWFVVRAFDGPNVRIRTWIDNHVEYGDSVEGGASVETTSGVGTTAELLEDMNLEGDRIGFEEDAWYLTYRQLDALRRKVDAEFVPSSDLVEDLRAINSEREIEYIRQAGEIVEAAVTAGIESIEAGLNENEVAATVVWKLVQNGCEHVGTLPYVTSGTRSALPHARWKGRTVNQDEIVFFEVLAGVSRYHATQCRTAFLGDPPDVVAEVGEVVAEGLTTAVDAIEPGVKASEVDAACRQVIEDAGYGDNFPHRTGYHLSMGFPPGAGTGSITSIGPWDDTVLEPNMTFHMPPIVFLPDHGAIGCSATVRVTEDGCEPLADLDRKLHIV